MKVTEIESPEDIKEDSPDGLYIQEGGTSTPSGGTTIHYYDSLDQVPADLPEGAFVTVPSTESGGSGLTVVELETLPTLGGDPIIFEEQLSAKMDEFIANGVKYWFADIPLSVGRYLVPMNYFEQESDGVIVMKAYSGNISTYMVLVAYVEGVWQFLIDTLQ